MNFDKSKTEEEMKKRSDEITKEVLRKLICRYCQEICHPPLFQCVSGHLICKMCLGKDDICEICNYRNTRSRPFILERLYMELEFHCKYSEYGCTFYGKGESLIGHHKDCEHFWAKCPDLTCTWKGKPKNIFDHYKNCHSLSLKHDDPDYKVIAEIFEAEKCVFMLNIIKKFERVFLVVIVTCSPNERIGYVATNMEPFNAEEFKLTIDFKLEEGEKSYTNFELLNSTNDTREVGINCRDINVFIDSISRDFTINIEKKTS